jgi:hypothetical protein
MYDTTKNSRDQFRRVTGYYNEIKAASVTDSSTKRFKIEDWKGKKVNQDN